MFQNMLDEELAQIVLVEKAVMEDWRKKQEQLKQDMEEENSKIDTNLRHEKQGFENALKTMQEAKKGRIEDLQKSDKILRD